MGEFPEECFREGLERTVVEQMEDGIMKRNIWLINKC